MHDQPPPTGSERWSRIGRLASISLYPVKGLGGVSLDACLVDLWGLAGDRLWCVVDEDGLFTSQRRHPAMATIRATPGEGGIELMASNGEVIWVPEPGAASPRTPVRIWKDIVTASVADDECNRWLSGQLSTACRLVHMSRPRDDRPIRASEALAGDAVSFADGFPLLCTATASLDWLRKRVDDPSIPMDRFRTNLVVVTDEPWIENGWSWIACGDVILEAVRPCARCVVVEVDQATGARDASARILDALASASEGRRKTPEFGQNLIPRRLGRLRAGDEVYATARVDEAVDRLTA